MSNARVMVPVTIVSSMLKTGTTIPEPDPSKGEVAWTSGGTYAVGNLRTYGGSIWNCRKAVTGSAVSPDKDILNWYREGPTNRMAPFDDYENTKVTSVGSLTYVLQPGFANGLTLYGMEGTAYTITMKDQPGGTVVRTWSGDLYAQAAGLYELLFTPLLLTTQISFDDLPLAPLAEFTITITSGPTQPVAIGTIKIGDWRRFIGDGDWGGTQYGAESDLKSFTLREYNLDGTYKITRRSNTNNVNCSIVIDPEQGLYARALLREILDIACPFEATDLPRYGYLNTLGFISGNIRADDFGTTTINLKVEGNT